MCFGPNECNLSEGLHLFLAMPSREAITESRKSFAIVTREEGWRIAESRSAWNACMNVTTREDLRRNYRVVKLSPLSRLVKTHRRLSNPKR